MNKYQEGKIYKIINRNNEGQCYIGSTCMALYMRFKQHKRDYRDADRRTCMSKVLFDLYGVENCKIELIENFPCDTNAQLLRRETEFIEINDCVNIIAPIKSKEQIKLDMRQIVTCDCGCEFQKGEKARHLTTDIHKNWIAGIVPKTKEEYRHDYYNEHKEHYQKLAKETYTKKKDYYMNKAKEAQEAEYICACGTKTNKHHQARHIKSKYHLEHINKKADKNEIKCDCGLIYNKRDKARHERTERHLEIIKNTPEHKLKLLKEKKDELMQRMKNK